MTALDRLLHEQSEDDAPERRERETWRQYHRRWWDYWIAKAVAQKREGYRMTPLGRREKRR